jgi:hypothetical protein
MGHRVGSEVQESEIITGSQIHPDKRTMHIPRIESKNSEKMTTECLDRRADGGAADRAWLLGSLEAITCEFNLQGLSRDVTWIP